MAPPSRTRGPPLAALARHFFTTFPQLDRLRFSHRWAGAIDTSTRFCAFFGTAHRGPGRLRPGYTGLGVGGDHGSAPGSCSTC